MAQTIRGLGIDIAKLVFHVVGMDDTGHVVLRKRLLRSELRHFVAALPLQQIQKFLGHAKLETTQIYAESTPEMIKESYQQALAG